MARNKTYPLITDFNNIPKEALVSEEEQPYSIPETWKWVRLGALIELVRGVTYKKNEIIKTGSPDAVLVLRGGNVREGAISLDSDNVYVPKGIIQEAQLVRKNDVVIVSSTGSSKVIGRAGVSEKTYSDVAFGAFLTLCRSASLALDKRYLATYFQSSLYRTVIRNLAAGVNINNIKGDHLRDLVFPLPTLEEQQQIVRYLDENLAKIDQVTSALETHLEQTDKHKTSLIQAAITGRLTHQWRDQHSVSMASWKQVQLGKLGKWGGGGTPSKSKRSFWVGGTIRWITSKDMKTSEIVDTRDHITAKAVEESTANLYQGPAICVVMRSGILRRTLPIAKVNGEFTVNQDLKVLHVLADGVEPDFIYLAFLGHSDRILDVCSKSGTTVESIEFSKLKDYEIELPVLPEQQEIARILDEQLERIERTDKLVAEVLKRLDTMKQQIVSAALAGRLSLQVR